MTPKGVFFTVIVPLEINEQALCQQLHFDPKRSKGTDCACAFSQCGRCVAMESGKGFGMVALSLSMSRTMTGMAVRPASSQAYLRLWPAMIS